MNLSGRYALHIVIVLALALVPVLVHSYAARRIEDCAEPSLLIPASKTGEAKQKRGRTMLARFRTDQWREGRVPSSGDQPDLSYAIVRSYDPKRLYYRPENTFLRRATPERRELEWVEVGEERLPVHRVYYGKEGPAGATIVAAYLLVYRGEPVANPYAAQILSAPLQMLRGSRPMTLFFVSGVVPTRGFAEAEERARAWLREAWATYRFACGL